MAEGGGFCDRHGPFDPPHRTCPYCAIEDGQRRVYGPPGGAPRTPESPTDDSVAATGFRRKTVEPDPRPGATEIVARSPEPDTPPEGDASDAVRVPLGWLVVKEPLARRGEVLPVRANQVIGRSGDAQWNDPRVSRQHARLTFEPPEGAPDDPPVFHLWPFGPANPVYINGREIRGATPLHENDEIRLGGTLFVFKSLIG